MPDIVIAGATFRNVPQIDIPKDGSGTASFVYEEGTKSITENGTGIDVSGYSTVDVDVPSGQPVIQSLSVTENGTYTAPSGVDGYSPVTVNVSGGGGGRNVQMLFDSGSNNAIGMKDLLSSITVAKTGTYTVHWVMSRNSNNSDVWTRLYVNDVYYGDRFKFTSGPISPVFNRLCLPILENVSLSEGDVLTVKGSYESSSATVYAANLIIEEQV